MGEFAPWAPGLARWNEDETAITGTFFLKADSRLRIAKAEVICDDQGLTVTFEKLPE